MWGERVFTDRTQAEKVAYYMGLEKYENFHMEKTFAFHFLKINYKNAIWKKYIKRTNVHNG